MRGIKFLTDIESDGTSTLMFGIVRIVEMSSIC